jgi:hypothetical protein
MKNSLSLLAIVLGFLSHLNAQTYLTDRCWVKPLIPELESLVSGDSSANSTLNQIFRDHQVHLYKKALPFAKNPVLLKIHEIHCDCNIDSLIADIRSSFSEKNITDFSKFEVGDENVTVYSPIDHMWYLTDQNPDQWLWHLKNTQCDDAWDITKGDPNVKLGVIDHPFDISHPDLATKISPHHDPFTQVAFTCSTANPLPHGTQVASCIAAETTEIGGTAQGQLAAAGFNCMMVGYRSVSSRNAFLQKALHASAVMGVKTITSCAGSGALSCSPASQPNDEALIVQEILNNGTAIIMPAGNGIGATNCYNSQTGTFSPFYPMHPSYDERIIIVTSTDKYDWHAPQGGNPNGVHARFPEVDLCSPGYGVLMAAPTNCGGNPYPYGTSSGTSYAAPIVAGIAGLVYSVNECIAPQDLQYILKNTTDPVVDAASFTGLIGTGRVNAYKAVDLATTYGNVAPITSNTTWSGDRFVKGTVTVSSGTLTINGTVRMAKDAKIVVNSGATLNINGGILTSSSGCSEMWDGILVNNNGRLFVQGNARIEDAEIAVDLKYGAYYYLNNSTFNRNYVHVKKTMPVGANTFTGDYRILRCKFLCQTTASIGLPTPVHTDLLPPRAGQRTNVAIHAVGVPKILVGSTLANANIIDNSDFGVFTTGVKRVEVQYNTLRDLTYNGVATWYGPGLGGETITISNNTFQRMPSPIMSYANTKTVRTRITYNNIDFNGMVSPPTFMTGILVEEITPAGGTNSTDYNFVDISHNTITKAPCGIKLVNLRGDLHAPDAKLYVGENIITHSKPDDNVQAGILLQNVHQPAIVSNTINNLYGTGFTHWAETGIRAGTSSQVSLFCNTINNIGRGIWVDGDIRPNTHLVRNIMNNSQTGLLLNWGYVGQQGSSGNPRDNQWQGSNWSPSNPNTLVFGVSGGASTFWVRNSIPSVYYPQYNQSGSGGTPVIFNTTSGSWTGGCVYTDGASFKTEGDESDAVQSLLAILEQDEPETERGQSMRWMGEYNVYQQLMADEELQYADQSLSAFHTAKASGNMGRLHEAVIGFNEARIAPSEEVSDGFTALLSVQPQNRVEQTLYDVLSMLYANATDLRTMNDGQVEQLRDIAFRCPLDDGLAVHVARAALLTIDTLPKGYMNECELAPPYNGDSDKENKVAETQSFAVYPNPNNGRMTVSYVLAEGEAGILRVHNTVGLLVMEKPLNASQALMEVDLNGIGSGLYLLSIEVNNERKLTERISVVR